MQAAVRTVIRVGRAPALAIRRPTREHRLNEQESNREEKKTWLKT